MSIEKLIQKYKEELSFERAKLDKLQSKGIINTDDEVAEWVSKKSIGMYCEFLSDLSKLQQDQSRIF